MKNLLRLCTTALLWVFLTLNVVAPATAGSDLTVSCPAIGSCSVAPVSTSIFFEVGWYPGSTATQRLTMSNTSGTNGFAAMEVFGYTETNNLGEVLQIEIRRNSPVGPVIYAGATLHEFRDDGYFTFDTLNAGQTTDYYLTATMPVTAGNQYQGAKAQFDLRMGLEITFIPPPSGSGDGTGSVAGTTTVAAPPVCSAQPPTSAPSLTITNVGVNTVSLSWTAVSPVTHYALIFTRTSDGEQYGSTNIGTVTSYTVTNLSGGSNYIFEIFGVNDCAPGPRSTAGTTGVVPGPVITGRPLGPGGEVLGETTASPTPSPSAAEGAPLGEVAGAFADACVQWKLYLPWILLVAQGVLTFATEYLSRRNKSLFKLFWSVAILLTSIGLFYWMRVCDCAAPGHLLTFLCRWYWVVALVVTLLIRTFSYAFLEEIRENEMKTKNLPQ